MEHDRCLLCHRKLKDHDSRIKGFGSSCWSKLKKLDKEEKAKRKTRLQARRAKEELLKGQITMFDKEVIE